MPHMYRAPQRKGDIPLKSGFLTSQHPKYQGYAGTGCGAFWGSFVLVLIMSIGFGFLSTADATGAAVLKGTHPVYLTHFTALMAVAFGAKYVSRHITGIWSTGSSDLWDTLLMIAKALLVKGEPLMIGHHLLEVVMQSFGSLAAMLLTWVVLQDRTGYSSGGTGLGGPGLTPRGAATLIPTLFFTAAIVMIRSLLTLWACVERRWTQQVETGRHSDGDHLTVGMTHHAKVQVLAAGDAILFALGSVLIGPIGFFWRDIWSLIFTDHKNLVEEDDEGLSMWLVAFIYPLLGIAVALAAFTLNMLAIKYQGFDKKE
jgi:hypothetical protein